LIVYTQLINKQIHLIKQANMNLSYLPSEIINMIKDFVFSKIPKDDIRYTMLHPIYANPYRWNFGNLISMGWTFKVYDGKLILFRTKVVCFNPLFDEEPIMESIADLRKIVEEKKNKKQANVLLNSEVSNRNRLKRDQRLQIREMRHTERNQSHNRKKLTKINRGGYA
jgi:hypothetical protein